MKFIKLYVNYLRDNPNGYWFKRRLFGWGWVPVKWQGWVIIIVYILALLGLGFSLGDNPSSNDIYFTFLLPIVLLTTTLIRICYKKGEKPKWSWGWPKEDSKY